ncbi:unnamed protein product [Victoria cruziana]
MLLEAKQAKGATASKKKAGGRGADTVDGKDPVNENYKERGSSVQSYGGRLIGILMAEEMYKEPERGSCATSASIPATYTDSLSDTDFGDIASLGDVAAKNSAPSLHLSQVMENHAMCEKNSLPENMGWDNPSEERPWIMNPDGHSGHPGLDELGKRLLEKHAHLQEKLDEAKEAILNHNFLDAKELARDMMLHQSKDFVDALEILNTDREQFLELLQNPNPLEAKDTPDKRPSHEEIICPSSLINADCSPKKHVKESKQKTKGKKWFIRFRKDPQNKDSSLVLQPTNLLKDAKHQKKKQDKDRRLDLQNANSLKDADRMDEGSHSPECATPHKPASGSPGSNKGPDPSLSSTNKFTGPESGKAGNGFRGLKHRLKQAIKDGRKEQLHISMDGILHKVPYGSKDVRKEMVGQHKETTANSVNREQARISLDSCPTPSSSIKDELDEREQTSSVTKSDIRDHPTAATLLNEDKELTPRISGKDQCSEEPASGQKMPSKGNEFCTSTFQDQDKENVVTAAHREPESDIAHNDNEEKVGNPLMHFAENRDIQHQELRPETTKITKTSPDSIMDCHFEGNSCHVEDPPSTSTFQDQEGLVPKQMDEFQRKVSVESQEDPYNETTPHDVLAVYYVHANQISVGNGNSDDVYSHTDEEDKNDFTFVKDVLRASGLRGDESPTQWHSREQPMDPLLFDEVESLPTGNINMVTGCNHQLLFDCINEALLEIYDRSCTRLMSLNSRTRPMPIGKYILDEVWAEISWHLESQSQLYPSVEYLVERDLARSNGWMDVEAEAKSIVIELESLLLNDLLDDALYQII